jgi:16S rRNA U516 pseudouridylate synthase RsuA-like enzyme
MLWQTTLKVIDPKSAHFGERVTGIIPRTTVYEVAARAGFPSDLGLAGRLDYMTSGIMLMSNDSRMLNGVIRPPQDQWEGLMKDEAVSETEEARRQRIFKYKTKVYEVRCFSDRLYKLSDFDAIAAELSEPFTFNRQGHQHQTSRAKVQVLRRWQSEEHSHGRQELGWSVDLRIELKEGKHHQV